MYRTYDYILHSESVVDSTVAARTQKGAGVSTNSFRQDRDPKPGPGAGSPSAGAAAANCRLPATPVTGNAQQRPGIEVAAAPSDATSAALRPLLFVNAHASAAADSLRSSAERLAVLTLQQQQEQQLIGINDERLRSSSATGRCLSVCPDGSHCVLPLERAYSEQPSTSRLIVDVPAAVALQIASADPSRGTHQYSRYMAVKYRETGSVPVLCTVI